MLKRAVDITEPTVVLDKIRYYCGYQERCIRDVEDKLRDWAVQKKLIPGIVIQMQNEGILDEGRFAKAFARGKFRLNKWGRQKIEFELKIRGIPEPSIAEGLTEIDDGEYEKVIADLIQIKQKEFGKEKDLNIREKIINFALGKGYEIDLILDLMNKMKI
jgi:regulatory protein